MKSLLLALLVAGAACSVVPAQELNIVRNGSFEEDADGDGMADDWQYAGDEGVTVSWTRDAGRAGRFSQKLTCTLFSSRSPASHVMLCQLNTVRLNKGAWYKISFSARQEGIPGRAIQVAISNTKSWSNCGLQESFRASSQWKDFEFHFRATETISDHTRLQFWYTSTGGFWLDNVRLEPSEPVVKRFTEIVHPTAGVNLLPNSSFECGSSGWGSIAELPGWGGNLNLLVGEVDTTAGMFHGSSFKIALTPQTLPVFYFDYFPLYRVPVKAPLLANRGWIAVEPGAAYTLSAYMKANREGLAGVLSVHQAYRENLHREIELTTQWKRYSFTFRPQAGQIFVAMGPDLRASNQDTGTAWIDAVQLEKGTEATPYAVRAPVEVGLETNQLGNMFPYGDEPQVTAIVFNAGEGSKSVTLNVQVTDFDDAIVHEAAVTVGAPPGRSAAVPIRLGVRRKGFYRLNVKAQEAEVALTRPMRLAIIEPYDRRDSLFGMNHAWPWPELLDLSKQIGLRWFRDWSLKWHDVEPEKGKFTFGQPDEQINRVLERDLNVIALLPFPSSNWSSSLAAQTNATGNYPTGLERVAAMPRDLGEFTDYVHSTVGHYRGRLRVWEILNEPVFTSYALPRAKGYQAADYVRLLRVGYQAVKEADPCALVIGGIAGGPSTYTQEFIEADGLRWVDALNLHVYPGLTAPDAYEEPLRQLREKMRSAGADKPIWFTEGAYYADDDTPYEPFDNTWLKPADSEIEVAEWQIKFNTLLLAYGAEKIIYHSGTPGSLNDENLAGIFFEWAGMPRKMTVTQSAMVDLLTPPVKSLGPLQCPETIKAYGFETAGRTVVVAWAKEDTETVQILLTGKPWRAVDLQGNELEAGNIVLTDRPVYFVSQRTTFKQLPW